MANGEKQSRRIQRIYYRVQRGNRKAEKGEDILNK
jgi:hypothetical protein